jgi:hypothetical protein
MRIFKLIEVERKLPWSDSVVQLAWQDKLLASALLQLDDALRRLKKVAP